MTIIEQFAEIVGAAHVLHRAEDIVRYDVDGRQGGGAAAFVVRPASTAEVSALMRMAVRDGLKLVVQGGRTGLVGSGLAAPESEQVVISLERLTGAPCVDPVNRTVEVDAGTPLSVLNTAAAAHGLFFPVDLGADPSVGGMVAANTGGARLLRYGDVRRNLLAAELVRADAEGTVVQLGRALWKDNSRLDLKQMIVGGAGSMGVVTRATLALQPLPSARVTAMVALNAAESATALLAALETRFGTLLSAFEGISQAALSAAFAHVRRLRNPFGGNLPPYALLIELSSGTMLDEEALEAALGDVLSPYMEGTKPFVRDAVIDRRDGLWAIRNAVPEGLRASGRVIGCDISLRRGDVMRFRDEVAERLRRLAPMLVLHDFGHIGDGGLHCNLVWPHDIAPFDAQLAEEARALVFALVVEEYGGSFSAEHGVGPVNRNYYERFVPAAERSLAGAVQRLIAPAQMGRVDFGWGAPNER